MVNDEEFIELTPLHSFACNLYRVMMNYGGVLKLSQFEIAYLSTIGSICRPADYGFPTIFALLQALPCTVTIKLSRRKKNVIYLSKKITGMCENSCLQLVVKNIHNESFMLLYTFINSCRYDITANVYISIVVPRYRF